MNVLYNTIMIKKKDLRQGGQPYRRTKQGLPPFRID